LEGNCEDISGLKLKLKLKNKDKTRIRWTIELNITKLS
jgi:hypothetical protein